ncbi:M [Inhangapi virus]|uniref:Matrix protein n=1 Tax=Inhangapi virus TaxID=1620892 RepID=A0A0N7IQX4_9RHAB|nr:M [Inhangapi virus] [Inhangapi virus]ALJ94019.1 M [Inhangapi virus] [Inhangapi virus]
MQALKLWKKKPGKPSAPSLPDSTSALWSYGLPFNDDSGDYEELPVYSYESVTRDYLMTAELTISTDKGFTSMSEIIHILEELVDLYDGPYLHKSTVFLIYLTLAVHIKPKNKATENQRIYGVRISEPVSFSYRNTIDPGTKSLTYKKDFRSLCEQRRTAVSFQLTLTDTKRKACPILDLYNIENQNGQKPPPINEYLNRFGYSMDPNHDGTKLEINPCNIK